MQQIDMSLAKLQIAEKAAQERKIEPAAVEGDQEIVGINGIFKFFHIVAIDEVMSLPAVVQANHGNLMTVDSHAGGFDVQKGATVSKIFVEPPAFSWRQNFVKISGLVPVLSGFLKTGLHQCTVLPVTGPMVKVQLELVPGENGLAPEVDLGSRADEGQMQKCVF